MSKQNQYEPETNGISEEEQKKEQAVQQEAKKGGSPVLTAVSVILLVGIIAAAVFSYRTLMKDSAAQLARVPAVKKTGDSTFILPDYTGKKTEDVAASLRKSGLGVEVLFRQASGSPEGTVLKQDPVPGAKAEAGSSVYIMESSGPVSAVMPDLSGMGMEEAADTLAGLEIHDIAWKKEFVQGVEAGTVLSTRPEAGKEVPSGREVSVTVCAGVKASETAPGAYVGMQAEDAANAAREARLLPVMAHAYSDASPAGTVIAQSVDRNAPVMAGTTICLTVSDGPAEIPAVRTEHVSLGIPETATQTTYRIVMEVETFDGAYEHILSEGDTPPAFPLEMDVPVPAGVQSLVLRYYEKKEDGYIPRASWTVAAVPEKAEVEVLDLDEHIPAEGSGRNESDVVDITAATAGER